MNTAMTAAMEVLRLRQVGASTFPVNAGIRHAMIGPPEHGAGSVAHLRRRTW